MRAIPALLAFVLVAQLLPGFSPVAPAQALAAPSTAFGAPGTPTYVSYTWTAGTNPKEPGVGVAWNLPGGISTTGGPDRGTTAMYSTGLQQYRLTFDDSQNPPALIGAPTPVGSAANAANTVNGDPLLFTDHRTGRTFAGGWMDATAAAVPLGWLGCAAMMFTDVNGGAASDWTAMSDTCSLPAGDHPTVGAGPLPAGYQPTMPSNPNPYPGAVYYCAQGSLSKLATDSYNYCWYSEDGGRTFLPGGTPDPQGACVLFNGHIRVGPTGTAYMPMNSCNGMSGLLVTSDVAQSWSLRTLPFPNSGTGEFDPSVAPTLDSGWIYFGQAEMDCACIALSKDGGLTWEDVGQGNGAPAGTKYFDVGSTAHDMAGNPVALRRFNFAEVIAGDDDRASFAFLGATGTDPPGTCNARLEWHLYVATTYDAGRTWTTVQATSDPVQRGGIWSQGGSSPCRNMLDFNDIALDAHGRVLVAYTDGCPNPCATAMGGQSTGVTPALARQAKGCGLLRSNDRAPGQCHLGVTKTFPQCDPPEAPIVVIEQPAEGDIIDSDSLVAFGAVDRRPTHPPIHAETNGPYSAWPSNPFPLRGSAWCGYGNGALGSFTCQWTPLSGGPSITSSTQCSTTASYPALGTFQLELTVTDTLSGLASTAVTTVMVKPGGPVTPGNPQPPPPPPPPTKACVDNATAAGGILPAVGPERDDDSWSSRPTVSSAVTVNPGVVVGNSAASIYEIYDVCADQQWNPNQFVVTIYANLAGSPPMADSPIDYLLYFDTKATGGSVTYLAGTPQDPSILVTMTHLGPIAFRPDTRTYLPASWVSYNYGNPPSTAGSITVTLPLPHGLLPAASGQHKVRVEVPGAPMFAMTPTSSHCTWTNPPTAYLPIVSVGGTCLGGLGTPSMTGGCIGPGCPNQCISTTNNCGGTTTCYGVSCNGNTNPYCFGTTGCAGGTYTSYLATPNYALRPFESAPDSQYITALGAGAMTPVGTVASPVQPSVTAAPLAQTIGALPIAPLVQQGNTLLQPIGNLAQASAGLPPLAVGAPSPQSLVAQAPAVVPAAQATLAAAPVPASVAASATSALSSLNLGSVLGLLGLGATSQATMQMPTQPVSSTPSTGEYVRVAFDWGETLYQPVATSRTTPRDLWGFTLAGLEPSMSGPHTATVSWFDPTGLVASAKVRFTIDLAGAGAPDADPRPAVAPNPGPDAALAGWDSDSDGILDGVDNCPFKANPAQADLDGDLLGDACDPDADGDGVPNGIDTCALVPDPDQAITHFPNPKGLGDACNDDWDADGIPNGADVCPAIADPKQEDSDNDRTGDACEAYAAAYGLAAAAPLAGAAAGPPEERTQSTLEAPAAAAKPGFGRVDIYGMVAGFVLVALLAIAMLRRRP